MTAFRNFIGIFCFAIATSALAGEVFEVLHSPDGVDFKQDNELVKISQIPEIIFAAYGHSVKPEQDNTLDLLRIQNPFNYPLAAIIIDVEGASSLELSEFRYPISEDISLDYAKHKLATYLNQAVLDENDLYSWRSLNDIHLEKLDLSHKENSAFMFDLKVLAGLQEKIRTNLPRNVVWIRLGGLRTVARKYGSQSDEILEAVSLLKDQFKQLESALRDAFGEKYLLVAITQEVSHSRGKRSIANNQLNETSFYKLNISKRYDESYASIFNIILWTSIFLLAALISTAIFICTLDPGRDSIIYRMTTQRIKKDN